MKLLKFYGNYCNPCKALTKSMEEVNIVIKIESLDVEENWELADEFKIKSVPTCILVDDEGNEVKRWVGTFNVKEELRDFIE